VNLYAGEMSLTTPALLFPAISLLLLAYTNRFLAISALIRDLHSKYRQTPSDVLGGQIRNLRTRLLLIRNMQALGVGGLFFCVLCMFVVFAGFSQIGAALFAFALLLLMASLVFSAREIRISVHALNLHLGDLEGLQARSEERSRTKLG
jgi:hypothetical protein